VILAAVALLLTAQDRTVTVEFGSMPLQKALVLLSAATGTRLNAAPAMRDEVLLMHVSNAPLDKLLGYVAKAYDARWDKQPDGSMLLRPDLNAQHLEAAQIEERYETQWEGTMAYLRKRLAAEGPFDQAAAARYRRLQDQEDKANALNMQRNDYNALVPLAAEELTPAWRAAARIALSLDPKAVLKMAATQKIVWAEAPTAAQQAFSPPAEDALRDYRKELEVLNPGAHVVRVLFKLTRWESGGDFSASLDAFDDTNKVLNSRNIRLDGEGEKLATRGTVQDPPPVAKPGESPMPMSDQASEYLLVMSKRGKPWAALRDRWSSTLVDPARFEPTSWMPSEQLIQAATAQGKNLVGSVPDTIFFRYQKPGLPDTPSQFLSRNHDIVTEAEPGWLFVKSSEPTARLPRSAAAMILKRSMAQGGLSVDDAAAWTGLVSGKFPFINWFGNHLSVLFPSMGPYSVLGTINNSEALRFWNALGAANQGALKAGHTVRIGSLDQAAQDWVVEQVYWDDAIDDIEATDVYPNGIADGVLSLKITETPVFQSWSSADGEQGDMIALDAKKFGTSLVRGSTYFQIPANSYTKRNQFRMGVSREYTLSFKFEPGDREATYSFSETLFDPSNPVLSELPTEIAQKVEEARQYALAHPPVKGRAGDQSP
jgi:hypothetical protein